MKKHKLPIKCSGMSYIGMFLRHHILCTVTHQVPNTEATVICHFIRCTIYPACQVYILAMQNVIPP